MDNQAVEAQIIKPARVTLPSITDGWRFNFKKHSKKANFQTYILVSSETPDQIEGCLIFQLKDAVEPYMAYVEVAPHNKGKNKHYDKVAGCLIAFACRLSFIHGKGDYKGWLTFDVMEESEKAKVKLMTIYCVKYGALKWGDTTMVIPPEGSEKLINNFLK